MSMQPTIRYLADHLLRSPPHWSPNSRTTTITLESRFTMPIAVQILPRYDSLWGDSEGRKVN